jgi:hypothetical protein
MIDPSNIPNCITKPNALRKSIVIDLHELLEKVIVEEVEYLESGAA